MKKNGNYWKSRMKALENQNYAKTAKYCEDMQNQFRMAQNSLQMDIEHWYQRLADNNGISYAAAKRLLKAGELEEFHWTVEEYIRHGKENALNQQWMKQLENASARVHINYLQAMKLQLGQHAELLYQKYHNGVTDFLTNTYSDQFYHTAYEVAKGNGVASNFAQIDTKRINLALTTPWAQDGKNFSDRIWQNKDKLVRELHTELAQCIIRGENPDKAARRLADSMGVKVKQARTLIYTESAAISMAAQKDCFEELGVEEYEIVETLDSITCNFCQDMDGKHFPLSDYQVGITAPPFHPNCRGCTCPYFNDEFTAAEKRSARNGEGDIYYVPSDMSYKEWKATFIDNNGQHNLVQIPQINDEKIRYANEEFSQILLTNKQTSYSDKMILYSGATEYHFNENLTVPFSYNPLFDIIEYNSSAPNYSMYDMNFVQAHELSHRIDMLEIHSWESSNFVKAVEICRQKVYDNIDKITEWFSDNGKYGTDIALSDIFSALSEGSLNDVLYSGHLPEYWKEDPTNLYLEIFANIASIDLLNYASKAEFEGILKELYQAYKELTE